MGANGGGVYAGGYAQMGRPLAAGVVESSQDTRGTVKILPRNHCDKAQEEPVSRGLSDIEQACARRRVEVRLRVDSRATGEGLVEKRRVEGMGAKGKSSQESNGDDQSGQVQYTAPGAIWTWPIHPTRQATH